MYFNKSFKLQMNGSFYNANVDFEIVQDEHDRDVMHSVVDEDSVVLEDEDGNLIGPEHDDYDDLMEDVLARDYEPSHWEL